MGYGGLESPIYHLLYTISPAAVAAGSQNISMAKQLKPIEGHIAQINAPRFAEDRKMWVIKLKSDRLSRNWQSRLGDCCKLLKGFLTEVLSGRDDSWFLMFRVIAPIAGHKVICLPAFGGVPLQGIFQIGEIIPQHFVHLSLSQRGNLKDFSQVQERVHHPIFSVLTP